MHLPKPFTGRRTSSEEGTRGDEPGYGSAAGGAPGVPGESGVPRESGEQRKSDEQAVRTVLPGLRRPLLTRPTVTGYASTLAAAVVVAVAAVAPSPASVLAERSATALPPVTAPAVPPGLPSGIEGLATYVEQTSCDPAAKPGTLKLSKLLTSTYPGTSAWSPRPCGLDGPGMRSEHYEGRGLDWSVTVRNQTSSRRAATVLGWLLAADAAGRPYATARRLGVMYMIWNNQMWRAYNASAGWRPYRDCAAHPEPRYDTTCHRDHIHFSLSWAGAMGRTSFWSRTVAGPDYGPCRPVDLNWATAPTRANPVACRSFPAVRAAEGVSSVGSALVIYSGAVIGPGATGPVVSAVQRALGVKPDGRFGTTTAKAVSSFRSTHRLRSGSQVDTATWRALLASFATPAGGSPGAPGSVKPAPAKPAPVKPAPVKPATSLAGYSGTVLRYGSRGPAVVAVQRALRVSPVSGWFGPATQRAVINFQASHGIPRTGNVGPLTWRALGS